MHGLGIPTSRALCIVGSDEEVYREAIETAAVLTRLAPSHVRFGSFEVFFYRGQHEQIAALADYVIARHFPHLADDPEKAKDKYRLFLDEVTQRTAKLMAQWQAVGFSHGVMNTDNMSILGRRSGRVSTYCRCSSRHARSRLPAIAPSAWRCAG